MSYQTFIKKRSLLILLSPWRSPSNSQIKAQGAPYYDTKTQQTLESKLSPCLSLIRTQRRRNESFQKPPWRKRRRRLGDLKIELLLTTFPYQHKDTRRFPRPFPVKATRFEIITMRLPRRRPAISMAMPTTEAAMEQTQV